MRIICADRITGQYIKYALYTHPGSLPVYGDTIEMLESLYTIIKAVKIPLQRRYLWILELAVAIST